MSTGFAFLHYGLTTYGWFMFLVLPIVLGISIGALPNKNLALAGSILTLIAFLLGLVYAGLEGYICILMTLPIVVPLMFFGSVVLHLIRRYEKLKSDKLTVLLIPLLIFIFGAPLENFFGDARPELVEVKSEIILPYSNIEVYNAIKSVDTLDAEKPFLMRLDLPVPVKCTLEKEAIGAIRTCYFTGGHIVERVTDLDPGKHLKMEVIKYELTGRRWLGFKDAIYLFDSLGKNSCKMTRITTYTSELRPRFYWTSLEKMGIEQEHEYVFRNLVHDLERESRR